MDVRRLTGRPVRCPEPGMERVFMHPQVAGRLRDRVPRFDGEFHLTLLPGGRIRLHRWRTQRTPRSRRAMALASVCPAEYSHITQAEADVVKIPLSLLERLTDALRYAA